MPLEDSEDLESIDEYQLLMLLWANNWDSFYWLLLALGISFLNFQIYSILLLSNPLVFVSLCATIGIFNPIIIFTFASFLILSIGFILSTIIYATYTFWNSYHQTTDDMLNGIQVWCSPKISILQVIKLLKDDKFAVLTSTLSNFIIPDHLKELIFTDASYRLLILDIFNKLQDFLPLYEHPDIFAEDFINFLIRVYPKQTTETQSKRLIQCFDLILTEHRPSYKIIHQLLENTDVYYQNHPKLLSLKKGLDNDTYYKILFNIKFLPLVEEAIKNTRDSISHTLNEFFYYAKKANITEEIDCLTPRPLSPIFSYNYFQKIKCHIFKYIWESFHTQPNQFWSIWQNINNHPNIDSIYPLIVHFCHHNESSKPLYSCILAITQVGWEHEVDIIKLKEIYADEKQKSLFISTITLLLNLNALIPQLFIRIIFHPKHEHFNSLLSIYASRVIPSADQLKDIYLLIILSKKNRDHHLETWEEVEEMINNKEESVPNLNHPPARKYIRSFSSRVQLSPISEENYLYP